MDRHSRKGTTKAFLHDGPEPGTTSLMVCVGDSITEGVGSADWVAMLRTRLGGDVQIVNDGIAGDLSWNALQRLDAAIQCEPEVVILLIGTNDVAIAQTDTRAGPLLQTMEAAGTGSRRSSGTSRTSRRSSAASSPRRPPGSQSSRSRSWERTSKGR